MTDSGIGHASTDDGFTTYNQPTASIAMPFDNSEGFQTLVQVSNVGFGPVWTHWSFWSDSRAPLGDVAICLSSPDNIILFTDFVFDIDGGNDPGGGELLDLTGQRGVVVVTAYRTDVECTRGISVQDRAIIGTYRIVNANRGLEYVSPAPGFGLNASGARIELPSFEVSSFFVGSSNPEELDDSNVVMFALQEAQGSAGFKRVELGPPVNRIAGEVSFPTGDPQEQLQATAPFSILGALFDSAVPGALLPSTVAPAGGGIIRFARFKSKVGDGVFVFGRHAEITDLIGAAARRRSSDVTRGEGIVDAVSTVSTAGYERPEDSVTARFGEFQRETPISSPVITTRRRSVLHVDERKVRTFSD